MKYRHYFIIFTFFLCCLVLVALTSIGFFDTFGTYDQKSSGQVKADQLEESFFKDINYYLVEKSLPFITFKASELTFSHAESKVLSVDPIGEAYRPNQEGSIHFKSKNAKIYLNKKEVHLDDEVNVYENNIDLKADKMTIWLSENNVKAEGHVISTSNSDDENDHLTVNSKEAIYRSKDKYVEYRGEVAGTLKRKKKYEESINFTTNSLNFDSLKHLAELVGSVHIMRENLDVYANNGYLYLENYNKKLKYYSLSDDVRLEERVKARDRSFLRKAFAEKLEGFMSEGKVVLTGYPKVFQEKDIIKGNRIIIRQNIETVEVDDANTNIILQDGEEKKL